MKLLIDIGNTSSKVAVAQGEEVVHFERIAEPWTDALQRLHRDFAPIESIVVSCVGKNGINLQGALDALGLTALWLRHDTPCAIKDVPEGYGADRLAADIGAYHGQRALLVIDAGTCITYDLIIDGHLTGGVISPGIRLRLGAMHDYTAALPAIDHRGYTPAATPLMAGTTEDCMLSAAFHGTRFEIEGYIHSLRQDFPDLDVVLTGGDQFPLSSNIIYTYDPLLVLRGLLKL